MSSVEDLVQAYVSRKLTRRQFVSKSLAAGLSLPAIGAILAACGVQTPSSAASGTAGPSGAPASAEKLTVAVDSWGTDDLCPVQMVANNFLQDYFNVQLVGRDENYEVVPALATDWTVTEEGLAFVLHPDATWEDGEPITAEDIKWNIEAMAGDVSSFNGHYNAAALASITSIEVTGEKELFLHLSAPDPGLFSSLSGAGFHEFRFAPPHYIQEVGVDGYNQAPKGGGPYIVKEWTPGERMVLERRQDFWSQTGYYTGPPQAKTLEIILSQDQSARFALLQSGQVDVVVNVPYPVAKDLPVADPRGINAGSGGPWLQLIQATGNMMIEFPNLFAVFDSPDKPTADELKPYDDARVREALELAVDKVAISEQANFGFTTPLAGLFFSGSVGFTEGRLQVSPYDPDRARQLLSEAGYPNGFETQLHYGPFPNVPGQKEWLEAATSYWQEVGIRVRLNEVPANDFFQGFPVGVPYGERERAWRPLVVQTFGRQQEALAVADYGFHKDGAYVCCWNDTTDELVAEIKTTMDEDSRVALLQELEDIVLAERWVIPMCETSIVMGYSDRVLSHPTPPFGSSFEQLWRVVLRD